MVLGAVVAHSTLGGAAAWGYILAAPGGGSILGGLAVLRARPRRPLVTATLGTFAFAGPVALLALRAPAAWIAAAAFVSGIGIGIYGTLWDTTLQQRVPAAALSRVAPSAWFASVPLTPLASALAGPLASALGVPGPRWLPTAWAVLGS